MCACVHVRARARVRACARARKCSCVQRLPSHLHIIQGGLDLRTCAMCMETIVLVKIMTADMVTSMKASMPMKIMTTVFHGVSSEEAMLF